ncbi:hypothetical protein V6N13_050610 [Hibiscus sabdariffa]
MDIVSRDDIKDEVLASVPRVEGPADGLPYYYMPPQLTLQAGTEAEQKEKNETKCKVERGEISCSRNRILSIRQKLWSLLDLWDWVAPATHTLPTPSVCFIRIVTESSSIQNS